MGSSRPFSRAIDVNCCIRDNPQQKVTFFTRINNLRGCDPYDASLKYEGYVKRRSESNKEVKNETDLRGGLYPGLARSGDDDYLHVRRCDGAYLRVRQRPRSNERLV